MKIIIVGLLILCAICANAESNGLLGAVQVILGSGTTSRSTPKQSTTAQPSTSPPTMAQPTTKSTTTAITTTTQSSTTPPATTQPTTTQTPSTTTPSTTKPSTTTPSTTTISTTTPSTTKISTTTPSTTKPSTTTPSTTTISTTMQSTMATPTTSPATGQPTTSQCPSSLQQQCPNPARCGRPSAISDLICFLNNAQNGLNFGLIGFTSRIACYFSYYYDCQPAKRGNLNILDVYGFIVNLTYPNKTTNKEDFVVIYIDLSVPGCPQFQDLTDPPYSTNSFNPSLLHAPTQVDLAYFLYIALYRDYKTACNVIPAKTCECSGSEDYDYSYSCRSKTPYSFKKPLAVADLSHIKNTVVYQIINLDSNTSAGQDVIDTFGSYASCDLTPSLAPGSDGGLDEEICTENCYDNAPYCNRFDDRNTLAKIVKSYGYDKKIKGYLDANKACTVATLFAQGFNQSDYKTNNYRTCNCDAFTSLVSLALAFPPGPQDYGALAVLTRGYTDQRLVETLLTKFFTVC